MKYTIDHDNKTWIHATPEETLRTVSEVEEALIERSRFDEMDPQSPWYGEAQMLLRQSALWTTLLSVVESAGCPDRYRDQDVLGYLWVHHETLATILDLAANHSTKMFEDMFAKLDATAIMPWYPDTDNPHPDHVEYVTVVSWYPPFERLAKFADEAQEHTLRALNSPWN